MPPLFAAIKNVQDVNSMEKETPTKKNFQKFEKLNGIISRIRDIFFPENLTCACCGADLYADQPFCPHCLKELPFNHGFICDKCGRSIKEDYPVCLECKANMPAFDTARSAFRYEGELVRMIKEFKTGGKYLASVFAEYMYTYVLAQFSDADFAVFVPMTEKDEKKRGYNQSELLAEKVCERSGLKLEREIIVKTRETGAQKELTRKERAENMEGSFRVHNRVACRGKNILIIDDVLTTGATAGALAKTLYGAGADKVYLLTIASVMDKRENAVK